MNSSGTVVEKRRQKRGLRTEEKVLAAAEVLFYRHGYAATQVSSILKESGVSTGSFYHHFGSKEAVIARLLERFHDRTVARLHGLEFDGLGFEEALRLAVSETIFPFRGQGGLYRALLARRDLDPELWEPMTQVRLEFEAHFTHVLGPFLIERGATDAHALIRHMMQILLGLLIHIVTFGTGPYELDDPDLVDRLGLLAGHILHEELKRQQRQHGDIA